MKKELKKLQKFRDQIKNWSADTVIKDKTQLNEYKRKIEIDMERFKVVERQSKTKAFSKHGLEKMENETAEQKRRRETKEWLSACVEELSNQSDAFEAEIEVLQLESAKPSKRKGKNSTTNNPNEEKVQQLEESVQRHKEHTLNLEIMMRLVENETLPVEEADDIRDLIEDYLERNQEDFDEFDVVSDMYESLNLEALATKESVKVVTNVKQLHEESGDAPAGPPQLQTALSGGSKIEPPKPRVVPPAPVTSPKAAAAAAAAAAQQEQQSVNQWGSRFPAPKGLEADGVGSGNGGNNAAVGSGSAAAAAAAAGKPIPRPNNNSNAAPGAGGIKDGNAAQQAFPPGPRPLSSDANQQQSAVEAANAVFTAHEVFDNPSQGARSLNEMSTSIRRSGIQSGSGSGSAQSINNASTVNSTLAQQQQQQQQQRQQQQQQQQRGGGGGGGGGGGVNSTSSTATVAHGDPSSRLRLLEASGSSRLLPSASDGVWTRRVRRAPQVPIPPSYPTTLLDSTGKNLYPVLENQALFERLDADALFFAFYHQQGTPQQYLAARELKRANWRFHKKYGAWFARREEPKVSTEEYEQGAYVYFDHAVTRDEYGSVRGWCQRSKPDFLFEYSHLENELQ